MNGVPALKPQFPDYGNVLRTGAAIKGAESRNALTQMQIQDYPEERNWLKKQRGFIEEDRGLAAEDRKRALSDRLRRMKREDIEWERKSLETATSGLAKVDSVNDYAAFYPFATSPDGLGINPQLLEDPSSFIRADGTPDEKLFDQYRISKVREGKDVIKEYEAFNLPEKATYDHVTLYGPKGQTKRISIRKGDQYTPPDGWSLSKPGTDKEYTVQQQIDDAVTFYKFKQRLLIDDTGFIKEGKEEEYDKLTESLAKDQRAILDGKKPSFLREQSMQRKPDETIVDYLKRIK